MVSSLQAHQDNNEKFMGFISKDQLQDFAVGFGMGICHGAANNVVTRYTDSRLVGKDAINWDKYLFNFVSFGAAHALNKEYLVQKYAVPASKKYGVHSGPNLPTAFGHGLGQIIAESFDPQNPTKPMFKINITLICAAAASMLSNIKTN